MINHFGELWGKKDFVFQLGWWEYYTKVWWFHSKVICRYQIYFKILLSFTIINSQVVLIYFIIFFINTCCLWIFFLILFLSKILIEKMTFLKTLFFFCLSFNCCQIKIILNYFFPLKCLFSHMMVVYYSSFKACI